MTAEGHKALTAELKHLKSVERPAIIAAISEAREHGDLSENAEYHAAKEKQGFIESRLAHLEDQLARAQVVDPSAIENDIIVFGATVTIVDADDEKESTYRIVGEEEADISLGKISVGSPIARAMIGKSVDDEIEVLKPDGNKKFYEIAKVEYV